MGKNYPPIRYLSEIYEPLPPLQIKPCSGRIEGEVTRSHYCDEHFNKGRYRTDVYGDLPNHRRAYRSVAIYAPSVGLEA